MDSYNNFFRILSSGLKTDGKLDSMVIEPHWEELYSDARLHAVAPIMFDGIQQLPKNVMPPRDMIFRWYADVRRVEHRNEALNIVLCNIVSLFEQNGIPFLMMKGQGVAQRYPTPLHRCSGDIDLLVLDNELERAVGLLLAEDGRITDVAPEKHTTISWQGVVIELHHTIIDLSSPKIYKIMNGVDFASMNTSVMIKLNDGHSFCVPVLEPSYELVYQLTHIMHHLLTEGIGMRQICDFALTMDALPESKVEAVRLLLSEIRLTTFFATVADICMSELGVDSRKWAWTKQYVRKSNTSKLLDHIMASGNFGRKSHEKVSSQTLMGNICNAWLYAKHCVKFYSLVTDEVNWMLIVRAKRWLTKKMMK